MCIFVVDILGKCAFSWWISWANVCSYGGYLGQMYYVFSWWISWANVHSRGGYLGQMCNFTWWISWANVQFHGGYEVVLLYSTIITLPKLLQG